MIRISLLKGLGLLIWAGTALSAARAAASQEPVDFDRHGGAKGGFPHENIEWVNFWATDSNATNLPRVCLIGDSICGNYRKATIEAMRGKAYFASLWGSACVGDSALLRQLEMVLERYDFDVIHVNNGLHGSQLPAEQYAENLKNFLLRIRELAPKATIVWARTTPLRSGSKDRNATLDKRNVLSLERNAQADAVVKNLGIVIVDDLYAVAEDHPEYYCADGTHFNETGCKALAASVVKSIEAALAARAGVNSAAGLSVPSAKCAGLSFQNIYTDHIERL